MLARQFNLPVAAKRDSQGVCFLGSVSIDEFLRSEFGVTPGRAVDEAGNVIGTHEGVLLYTLGERAALQDVQSVGPWFVLAKDLEKNELVVGKTRISDALRAQERIAFTDANWLDDSSRATLAQYRYRGPRIQGYVDNDTFVSATELAEIPTPGQSVVFYRDTELIGGGIIAV
jgi:tRNA-specific 2-thiouridylase